jgi:hypothetical protein
LKPTTTTTRETGIIIGALAIETNVFDWRSVPDELAQVNRLFG